MNTWTFSPSSTVVVTGTNPENADITNPRGESFGLLWYVQGSNEHGDTAELAVISATEPSAIAAVKLATRLNARVTDLKRLPVGFEGDDERWARIGG